MAFEGLNNLGEQGGNAIVVFNDNQMSIAENHGGFLGSLRKLRETKGADPCNFFKALGLDYLYVNEGNDVHKLIAAKLREKELDPTVVNPRYAGDVDEALITGGGRGAGRTLDCLKPSAPDS